MAIRKGAANRFAPIKGWVTEGNLANYQQDVALDIQNMTIDQTGLTERRYGFLSESGDQALLPEFTQNARERGLISMKSWQGVGDGLERNLLIFHSGNYIYVLEDKSPISFANVILTINLTQGGIAVDGGVVEPCHISVGINFAVVTNPRINPVLITYDGQEDDGSLILAYRTLDLKVRTRDLLKPFTEGPNYGTALTAEEEWNLYNSGWPRSARASNDREGGATSTVTPIKYYFDKRGFYPTHSVLYSAMKLSSAKEVAAVGAFSPWEDEKINFGNTTPPLGRFVHSAYSFDSRSIMLEQLSDREDTDPEFPEGTIPKQLRFLITDEGETVTWTVRDRPRCSAYHNGHVYFADKDYQGKTRILVSQLVSDFDNIEKCYQDADPSAEEINDLIATDGFSMFPVGMGTVLNMIEFNRGLMIIATNGAWQIKGTQGGGATATDFTIDRVATFEFFSPQSVVDTGAAIILFSERGIIAIGTNEFGDITSQNLTDATIDEYYQTLPRSVIKNVKGTFVTDERRCYWCIPNPADSLGNNPSDAEFVLVLNMDTGGFFKYTTSGGPVLHLPYTKLTTNVETITDPITETDGTPITTTGGEVIGTQRIKTTSIKSEVGYFASNYDNGTLINFSAAALDDTFYDWNNIAGATPTDAKAFIDFAYEYPETMIGAIQMPYVHSFFLSGIRSSTPSIGQGATYHTEYAAISFNKPESLMIKEYAAATFVKPEDLLTEEMAVVSFYKPDPLHITGMVVVSFHKETP